MRLLAHVDADEVSPVRRAANRRGLVLKEDGMDEEPEIADIMAVPWEHEGAMVDALRKAGAEEIVLKSAVGAMRLLTGVADELPDELRETVEKLGSELYAHVNPKLNSGTAADVPGANGQLTGSADGDEKNTPGRAGAGNPELDGEGRDGELTGHGADKKVAATDDDMDDDDWDTNVTKRTFTADERKRLADSGAAMPGGRYPIANRDDLSNAIHAVGRGKGSHAAIRAHIISRAKALGASSMLPDGWVQKDDEVEIRVSADTDASGIAAAIRKALRRRSQDERPSTPDDDGDGDKEPDDDQDDTTVNKGGTVETHVVPVRKEDGTWDLSAVPEESRPFYTEMIEKADRLEKAESDLAETRDALRTREIIAKAETEFAKVGAQEDLVEVLKDAGEKLQPEAYEKLVGLLATANERIEKGDLFAEMGRTYGGQAEPSGDAWGKIEKAADDLVEKSDDALSRAQAIDRVLKTAEGKQLYSQYLAENVIGGVS